MKGRGKEGRKTKEKKKGMQGWSAVGEQRRKGIALAGNRAQDQFHKSEDI